MNLKITKLTFVYSKEIIEKKSKSEEWTQFVDICVSKYQKNDWGEISNLHKKENDICFENKCGKIIAAYTKDDMTIWIISYADEKSAYVLLQPE